MLEEFSPFSSSIFFNEISLRDKWHIPSEGRRENKEGVRYNIGLSVFDVG
jgi:hypothetical protein